MTVELAAGLRTANAWSRHRPCFGWYQPASSYQGLSSHARLLQWNSQAPSVTHSFGGLKSTCACQAHRLQLAAQANPCTSVLSESEDDRFRIWCCFRLTLVFPYWLVALKLSTSYLSVAHTHSHLPSTTATEHSCVARFDPQSTRALNRVCSASTSSPGSSCEPRWSLLLFGWCFRPCSL